MTDIVGRLRGLVYHEEYLEEAATEIERLRSILRKCMPGANFVELGKGEVICLYQRDAQS